MDKIYEVLGEVAFLSGDGIFGYGFEFLKASGSWAEAVSKLLGLL
ncbi:porin [Corynebacterium crudilactis]|uniref:Porin n=1 Tax=Corynebacterium crudilactis TaxID=1652495 RepID=A0A172QW09_9CORY|nr:porin [Corynebacterium crudilactis]ANE04892.1 porin [Corynebacterium crudilactis]